MIPARPVADRILAALPVAIGVVATACLVHFGTILAYPSEVEDDAFARVAAIAPVGVKTELSSDRRTRLPFRDAAMTAVVCRFDLGGGPFRIATPAIAQGFLSIGLYDRRGHAFSGLNLHDDTDGATVVTVLTPEQKVAADASDPGGGDQVLSVVAPGPTGLALVEAPNDAATILDAVTCGSAGAEPGAGIAPG